MQAITKEIKVSDMRAMRESGMSNKEIASALGICPETVRTYIGSVHPRKSRSKVTDDVPNDNPSAKTFGDRCQEVLDRQAGKPFVQFEILEKVQSFRGADCTYVVDYLHGSIEFIDGALQGKMDVNQIAQVIAELTVLREKLV